MQTAKIIAASTRIFVESPYNAELVSEIKEISGRKWHPTEKVWSVPAEAEQRLREVVRQYFAIEGEESKVEYEVLRLRVFAECSAKRTYFGTVTIDGHEVIRRDGSLGKSDQFEVLKSEGGFLKGDGHIRNMAPFASTGKAWQAEYIIEVKARKGAKIEAVGHADHWGSFEVLGSKAEDNGSSTAKAPARIRKSRKEKKLSPELTVLRLPEGCTVRKVGGCLKVVSAKSNCQMQKAA